MGSSTYTFVAKGEETFVVEKEVAEMSQAVLNMVEDTETDTVPLPNVDGKTLSKVIEYCKRHVDAEREKTANEKKAADDPTKKTSATIDNEIADWEEKVFLDVHQSELFDVILAANYMNIKTLLDLGCKRVANMIKGKTPEEIRKQFNIKNDFALEEE